MRLGRLLGQLLVILCLCAALTGCGSKEPKGKIRDLECSVLEEDQIPQPLMEVIEENKGKEMKLSYQKDGALYIARGFGEQKTGGYSITVTQCYLAEDGIHVQFELLGPPAGEKPVEEPSYPYLVIQMEAVEGNIHFD